MLQISDYVANSSRAMMTEETSVATRSDARTHFAERLRSLRIPRGYRTARSFAKALGIDENRYTRYERAEVEPDLGLIRRICQLLGVTPNELLGTAPPLHGAFIGTSTETSGQTSRSTRGAPASADVHPQPDRGKVSFASAAWKLSGLIAVVRHRGSDDPSAPRAATIAFHREAVQVYLSVTEAPEAALNKLANDPALLAAGPDTIREFVALSEAVSAAAGGPGGAH